VTTKRPRLMAVSRRDTASLGTKLVRLREGSCAMTTFPRRALVDGRAAGVRWMLVRPHGLPAHGSDRAFRPGTQAPSRNYWKLQLPSGPHARPAWGRSAALLFGSFIGHVIPCRICSTHWPPCLPAQIGFLTRRLDESERAQSDGYGPRASYGFQVSFAIRTAVACGGTA